MVGGRICIGRWGFATGMLVLALLAASCASPTPEGEPAQPAAPVTTSPTSLPTIQEGQGKGDGEEKDEKTPVPRELRFTAPALGGGTIRGADFAGKDLVMWFWAPW